MKPVVNWGFVKYSGYILNPDSKKTIALMNINGKSAMMAEGETTDNVKLLKNMHDSLTGHSHTCELSGVSAVAIC